MIKSTVSAQQRKNRIKDVYVGLDVWGRGCPGGGGFNSAHVSFLIILVKFNPVLIFSKIFHLKIFF